MRSRFKALAAVAAVTAFAAGPAWAERMVDESADAHPRGEVDIANTAGQVTVTGWDHEQVKVSGELGAGAERLLFEADGRRTEIKVILPRGSSSRGSSDLEVMVPKGSRVSINGVSAEIMIREVEGALRLQTVSGEIDVEVYGEDVEAKTVSGQITIRGQEVPALLVLNTVSGDADISRIRGELVANSVTGDLDISSAELARARIRTTNGDIDLSTGLAEDGRVDMEAINGDLRLDIINDVNAEFDIETFNGSINNDFGPDAEAVSRYTPGKSLRFTEGDGSSRVRIKTLNGTISLRGR